METQGIIKARFISFDKILLKLDPEAIDNYCMIECQGHQILKSLNYKISFLHNDLAIIIEKRNITRDKFITDFTACDCKCIVTKYDDSYWKYLGYTTCKIYNKIVFI